MENRNPIIDNTVQYPKSDKHAVEDDILIQCCSVDAIPSTLFDGLEPICEYQHMVGDPMTPYHAVLTARNYS